MITKLQDSDVSIAQIAQKADIPTPTSYYWMKLAKIADLSSRGNKKKSRQPRKSSRTVKLRCVRRLGDVCL